MATSSGCFRTDECRTPRARRTGFDPRALATPYRWFRISPRRIQAWCKVNEMPDRELMRDGRRLV